MTRGVRHKLKQVATYAPRGTARVMKQPDNKMAFEEML